MRVLSVGTGQVSLMRYCAHLALHQVSDREHQFLYLTVLQLREKIGLVLDRVKCSRKKCCSIDIGGTCIMAGGDAVIVLATSILEGTELDEAVAHHIGIGYVQPPLDDDDAGPGRRCVS